MCSALLPVVDLAALSTLTQAPVSGAVSPEPSSPLTYPNAASILGGCSAITSVPFTIPGCVQDALGVQAYYTDFTPGPQTEVWTGDDGTEVTVTGATPQDYFASAIANAPNLVRGEYDTQEVPGVADANWNPHFMTLKRAIPGVNAMLSVSVGGAGTAITRRADCPDLRDYLVGVSDRLLPAVSTIG